MGTKGSEIKPTTEKEVQKYIKRFSEGQVLQETELDRIIQYINQAPGAQKTLLIGLIPEKNYKSAVQNSKEKQEIVEMMKKLAIQYPYFAIKLLNTTAPIHLFSAVDQMEVIQASYRDNRNRPSTSQPWEKDEYDTFVSAIKNLEEGKFWHPKTIALESQEATLMLLKSHSLSGLISSDDWGKILDKYSEGEDFVQYSKNYGKTFLQEVYQTNYSVYQAYTDPIFNLKKLMEDNSSKDRARVLRLLGNHLIYNRNDLEYLNKICAKWGVSKVLKKVAKEDFKMALEFLDSELTDQLSNDDFLEILSAHQEKEELKRILEQSPPGFALKKLAEMINAANIETQGFDLKKVIWDLSFLQIRRAQWGRRAGPKAPKESLEEMPRSKDTSDLPQNARTYLPSQGRRSAPAILVSTPLKLDAPVIFLDKLRVFSENPPQELKKIYEMRNYILQHLGDKQFSEGLLPKRQEISGMLRKASEENYEVARKFLLNTDTIRHFTDEDLAQVLYKHRTQKDFLKDFNKLSLEYEQGGSNLERIALNSPKAAMILLGSARFWPMISNDKWGEIFEKHKDNYEFVDNLFGVKFQPAQDFLEKRPGIGLP